MNKNLITMALISSCLLNTAPTRAMNPNAAYLSLIGLTVLNYNIKGLLNPVTRAVPPAQRNILSIGEPILNVALAFNVHHAVRGNYHGNSISESFDNLMDIGNAPDPVETIFKDGGKIFLTAGATYSIGKYAYNHLKESAALGAASYGAFKYFKTKKSKQPAPAAK
jgi:hypothetical protein